MLKKCGFARDPDQRGQTENTPLPQKGIDRDDKGSRVIDFKISPINGPGSENISKRIIDVREVLGSDTGYTDLLAGLIDAFQDTLSTKKKFEQLGNENLGLKTKLKEINFYYQK